MADSYIIYTASGAQDTFSIPFGYLDPDHVHVSVNNVDVTFDFPTGAQVQTDVMPTNGQLVKVYRTTPRTSREVVWQNASNLTATDLNTSDLQLLYIMQEAFDRVNDAVLKNNSGLYDANSTRIINVGTPIDPADAATKAYVDASTVDIVDDAEDARDAAIVAQTGAEAALAACLTIYDNFDDRYLGQKSSAPTLDNDGNALLDGALYYNTTDNKMYVYDLGTTSWLAIETNIPDGIITTAKLANLAVTAAKIANTTITGAQLANDAVSTTAKIANAIVTYAKMATASLATAAADLAAGTASMLVTAVGFKAWVDDTKWTTIVDNTISVATPSVVVNVTGYTDIIAINTDVTAVGSGDRLWEISVDGGATYISSYKMNDGTARAVVTTNNFASTTAARSGWMMIRDIGANVPKTIECTSGDNLVLDSNAAITHIRFRVTTGNIGVGRVVVRGRKY